MNTIKNNKRMIIFVGTIIFIFYILFAGSIGQMGM